MAEIVLGVGTSHTPQINIPWDKWDLLREKDENDKRMDYQALLKQAKPGLEGELTSEKWRQRDTAAQRGVKVLGDVLKQVNPDVVLIFGDDQQEQFHDNNMPMLSIYHGETFKVRNSRENGRQRPAWAEAEHERLPSEDKEYPAAPELAGYLLEALTLDEFDVARTNELRSDIGIGHAFAFLHRRVWPDTDVPVMPFMVNTYYPPNQPTAKRCYKLGQSVRRAIKAWPSDARVAIMASGGLSHVILEEDLDRITVDALQHKDSERLCALPRNKMKGGTSEILNWVALAGAVEPMQMTLVDYVPAYRSPASTGCGMGFAYWQ